MQAIKIKAIKTAEFMCKHLVECLRRMDIDKKYAVYDRSSSNDFKIIQLCLEGDYVKLNNIYRNFSRKIAKMRCRFKEDVASSAILCKQKTKRRLDKLRTVKNQRRRGIGSGVF